MLVLWGLTMQNDEGEEIGYLVALLIHTKLVLCCHMQISYVEKRDRRWWSIFKDKTSYSLSTLIKVSFPQDCLLQTETRIVKSYPSSPMAQNCGSLADQATLNNTVHKL